ncbi:hypothetical protein [Bifidobacterium psychraerophilum]|uniref:Lipoprotein n=1 Tax=Bifidobacterium psychraerophilum TaxID=218140 RepID=A0A087CJ05_9BIFI|nr:hypothetical protein [Bifidobacterium psychraerophilum]KFI83255.1 hypothetical protein BPSY_0350 [Bifidobacterium psychraerophilum]PKA94309.1 hypothetical protein A9A89_0515 [Bifidobacterium psychraerophilum DSM 22366]
MHRRTARFLHLIAATGTAALALATMSACASSDSTAQLPTPTSSASITTTGKAESSSPSGNTSSNASTTGPSNAPDNLGSYRQLFTDPTLAQCMAEIMDQHVDDQLTRTTAEDLTGIGGIGVANGYALPDTQHPYCGIALKDLTSLSGIEHFSNIQTLDLDDLEHLQDLTPIRGLNRLMLLRLNGTAVTDYSQLNSPTRIFNLDVYINSDQPAPTIEQQRAWRINIITQ